LEIQVGDRVIKSRVIEKDEAKRIYEEAKQDMKKTAILEQETASIFNMSIANIEPGQELLVNLTYFETVKYENGDYEFVFPMTVKPRYDTSDRTSKVSENLSPPIIPFHMPSGREVKIFVDLDAGFKIDEVTSPSHDLSINDICKSRKEITLAREREIPNKDFILTFSPEGEKVEKSIYYYRKESESGTFLLNLTPKMDYGPEEMIKREVIFVIDRSGSMSGAPMEQARKALKASLRSLRQGDLFNTIKFDYNAAPMSQISLEYNDQNLLKADKFIECITARGGTEMLKALHTAFNLPHNTSHLRQIIFLTDGEVWEEESILKEISSSLGDARIFTFGIGLSVNRYFLDKAAKIGRGTSHYITGDQNIEEEVQKFANDTSFPILSDLSLEWKGGTVADIYPAPLPDLYFGQNMFITGRFHSAGTVKAILKGKKQEFTSEIILNFPKKDESYPVLEKIWAKKRIETLLDRQRSFPKEKTDIRDEIIGIGMKYHLLTPYTSLLALEIDEMGKEKKEIITIDVPLILPEDVNYNAPYSYSTPASVPINTDCEFSFDESMEFLNEGLEDFSVELDMILDDICPSDPVDAINLTLKWLARNQSAEGCWSNEEELERKIISTALGVLTFTGQGHTDTLGNYKPQVGKAITFIKNNIDTLSSLPLALSCWVLFELYNISPKKKEKKAAESAAMKLKDKWNSIKSALDRTYAVYAGNSAIKTGLVDESDLPHLKNWLVDTKKMKLDFNEIKNEGDLLSSFMNLISENKELSEKTLSLISGYHIETGADSGSIHIENLSILHSTSLGGFLMSFPFSSLSSEVDTLTV